MKVSRNDSAWPDDRYIVSMSCREFYHLETYLINARRLLAQEGSDTEELERFINAFEDAELEVEHDAR